MEVRERLLIREGKKRKRHLTTISIKQAGREALGAGWPVRQTLKGGLFLRGKEKGGDKCCLDTIPQKEKSGHWS